MNNKGFSSSVIGWILVIVLIIVGSTLLLGFNDNLKSLISIGNKEESIPSVFFSTEYVGTYNIDKPGTPDDCTKTNNDYDCKSGTSVEFYVGILNKGENKRYFYPTPCIIKDYNKGDTCRSDNAQFLTSYRPCGVEPGVLKATDCAVGFGFTVEKGKYRVFPGAKCLPEECADPTNPGANDPKVNYESFFEITVK